MSLLYPLQFFKNLSYHVVSCPCQHVRFCRPYIFLFNRKLYKKSSNEGLRSTSPGHLQDGEKISRPRQIHHRSRHPANNPYKQQLINKRTPKTIKYKTGDNRISHFSDPKELNEKPQSTGLFIVLRTKLQTYLIISFK